MIYRKIKRYTQKILRKIRILKNDDCKDSYVSIVSPKAPWVYIAYIADVFFHLSDEEYLSSHQNKREALAQVEIFNKLGYNVFVQDYLSKNKIPKIKFSIVFGHEPNFVRASIKNPTALKIHYVPGAYIDHRNGQIIKMTDYVNQMYNCNIPYRRLLEFDNQKHSSKIAYEIADKILLIGSKYTIATFPIHLQPKIVPIHQSTQATRIVNDIQYSHQNEYFFMGSYGNILKGITLLIEYFSSHQENTINIVGPLEPDVENAIKKSLSNNIKLHGYIDINSDKMTEIMQRCNFIIYPSGSEGMPGAVLNSMKNGLIPIVTQWAAFDEIKEFGYLLEDWSVDSIGEGVTWSKSMGRKEILQLKQKCAEYVKKTYNLNQYKKEFEDFIIANTTNL